MTKNTAGHLFRTALTNEKPLQIVGTINAYTALLARESGYKATYLSGAGVANASFGLPDLAITTLNDVLTDVSRITSACNLPLLVDIDTGWGGAFNIQRTIKEMIKAGAAAVHMEDQESIKRCGHRPGKKLVTTAEMVDRIKAAVDARTDDSFVIMARTDAIASEGLEKALERCHAYIAAGADMIFAEAVTELPHYKIFTSQLKVPILANITEFGKTPLFTVEELRSVNVDMVLYPLSAFRAMNQAALCVYQTIRTTGTQKKIIDTMQTREELYQYLNYYAFEQKLDQLEDK
jgi:methylisocitrate lyase